MVEQKIIDVEPRHLKMVQSVFAHNLPFKKVWAYGSRVKWTARKTSDLDCVVFGATDMEIYKAQEAFDESDIPFEVQLLNWETIPDDFKENIKKEYFVMRKESYWGEKKIGDYPVQIIDGDRGANYPKKEEFSDEGFCLFLNTGNVTSTGFNFTNNAFISKEKHTKLRNGHLIRNDVVLTTRGTVGNTAFYSNKIHYDVVRINSGMIIFRPDTKNIDPCFLYNALRSEVFKKQVDSFKSGSAQPQLPIGTLNHIKLPFPPLPTQRKIAGILSAYDDLIENNNKRIKILEEMAQKLYKEWFVDFKFPNHENTKFVESELGRIPEGWAVAVLKDFGAIHTGKTPSTKNPKNFGNFMPFIKTPDMHGGIFCIKTGEYLSEIGAMSQKNKILPPDSICVSCIGTVGVVAITTEESQTNQQINTIVLIDTGKREFLYFALCGLKETIAQYGSIGATMANLSKGKFEELKIVSPKNELIYQYSDIMKPAFENIKYLAYKNENLRKTRDLLLPRLISGELSVEDLENLE